MQNAAIRLLGLDPRQIMKQARGHHPRPAAPGDRLDDDRGHQPQPRQVPRQRAELAEPELEKIGLVLINVNITDITDESGYIEAMGRKAASRRSSRPRSTSPSSRSAARSASPRPSASRT
jgi:flotillin